MLERMFRAFEKTESFATFQLTERLKLYRRRIVRKIALRLKSKQSD